MKKDNYWQAIRGICIILIILIHTLYTDGSNSIEYFNIIIRRIINFATAVFIFMAGYFTKYSSPKEFYKKKMNRLLLPLVIWDFIYLIVSIITNKQTIAVSIKQLVLLKTAPQLYYIFVLLQLFILCPIMLKIIHKSRTKRILYLPLLITPMYTIFITIFRILLNKNFVLYNYWFLGWISYYYLGLLIRNKEDKKIININPIIPILFIIISILEGIFIKKCFNIYELSVSQLTLSNFIYSIIICLYLCANKNKKTNSKLLCNIGNYSFGIYLSHVLFVRGYFKFYEMLNLNYYTKIILIFISTLVTSYILNKLYYKRIINRKKLRDAA